MAVFEYTGIDQKGKEITGIIDADSPKTARIKLRKSGIFPVDIFEGKVTSSESFTKTLASKYLISKKVTVQELSIMTRQMATLVGAGLPLMESLNALMEQTEKDSLKRIIGLIRQEVKEGLSLANALKKSPDTFSELYINMVRAGEESGTLELMLIRLADFLENQVKLRNKVMASMTYPILMLIIGVLILSGLFTFVIPKVTSLFEDMHQTLPTSTIILIGISNFMRSYWWILLGLIILISIFIKRYTSTPEGRLSYDSFILNSPMLGKIVRMISISRFTRTLSTLLSSGIPLLQAIQIVKNVINNKILEKALESASENIREGENIADPLRKSGLFPPLVIHMIAVGEKSGELEKMLLKVSDAYDSEVETTISGITSILAPIMILIMGLIVLFIVMAILLPIFEMSQIVS